MNKFIITLISVLILIIGGASFIYLNKQTEVKKISNFTQCAKPFPLMESYLAQCRTSDGRLFIQEIVLEEKDFVSEKGEIVKVKIEQNLPIENPLQFSGKAKGTWFFEGSFPIEITDRKGNIIAQKYATAEGEWMTTDYVSFSAEITYPKMQTGSGFVIIRKDNPSDMRELDDFVKIPVVF